MKISLKKPGHLMVLAWLLCFTSPHVFAETASIDYVIAVVNEGVILSTQLEDRLKIVRQQIREKNITEPPEDVLRQQILERLIIESLQLQLANRVGVKVDPTELNNAIENIARQNNMTISDFQPQVEASGLDFNTFRKSIEQEIIMQRIQQAAVNKRIDVTDQDVINFLNSEEGKQGSAVHYRIAHILLSSADEILAKQIVAEARGTPAYEAKNFSELTRQYSQAQDAETGGDLGWRKKSDLPSLYADKVDTLNVGQISDPFLAGDAYHILKLTEKRGAEEQWVQQTRARHILVKPSIIRSDKEAANLLTDIRQQIISGTAFTELAKKYSEDYGTALKGGDLGWTSPGQLVPEFERIMSDTAINDISQPFQSQYGWHILQVIERRTENMSAEMLKQNARNYLMKRRAEEELPVWLKEIRAEAYVDIKTPRSPALEPQKPEETTPPDNPT